MALFQTISNVDTRRREASVAIKSHAGALLQEEFRAAWPEVLGAYSQASIHATEEATMPAVDVHGVSRYDEAQGERPAYVPFLTLYREPIPQCETVLIPGAGHVPQDENPTMTRWVIGACLARVSDKSH